MQDYGGPVGFRIFAQRPDAVKGFVIQNTNAFFKASVTRPKQVLLPLWEKRNAESEKAGARFVSPEGTQFQWLVGAKDPEAINPDNWISRPGAARSSGHAGLSGRPAENYKTNIAALSGVAGGVPRTSAEDADRLGKARSVLYRAGRRAYLNDLPDAKLVWLDSGHFVLDENGSRVAGRNQGGASSSEIKAVDTAA